MSDTVKEFPFEFCEYENASKKVTGKIKIGKDSLGIYIDTYGECTTEKGEGSLIILEKYEGELKLMIWDDIREQDPTVVNLENASEDRRLPDDLETL